MMINCTKSKNSTLNEHVDDYYNRYNNGVKYYYDNSIYKAKLYSVPSDFYEEFSFLYYYYSYFTKPDNKTIKNYIKKVIKNDALTSILNKIEKKPELYVKMKELFIKYEKFSNPGFFNYINNSAVLYIFYTLKKAFEKTPEWVKDSNKYNL